MNDMEMPVLLHLSITFDGKRGAYGPLTYVLNISIHKRATKQLYYGVTYRSKVSLGIFPIEKLIFVSEIN